MPFKKCLEERKKEREGEKKEEEHKHQKSEIRRSIEGGCAREGSRWCQEIVFFSCIFSGSFFFVATIFIFFFLLILFLRSLLYLFSFFFVIFFLFFSCYFFYFFATREVGALKEEMRMRYHTWLRGGPKHTQTQAHAIPCARPHARPHARPCV